MNYGDGIYGGMFMSGMYAAAFFENDPRKVVEAGLARSLPPTSPYGTADSRRAGWSKQYPGGLEKSGTLIERSGTSASRVRTARCMPFNIDAKLNGGYVALGLLYGTGISQDHRCRDARRQDSDCNPASAGGIPGVMPGTSGIPDHVEGRHSGPGRSEVPLHRLHLPHHRGEHREARPRHRQAHRR